jgi:hypothetical protein
VVGAPFNLVFFNDVMLERMVQLYYGHVEVKSVPLRQAPFWDEPETRAALRPQDRLFAFEPDS